MKLHQKIIFIVPPVMAVLGLPALIVGMEIFPVLNNTCLVFQGILLGLPVCCVYCGLAALLLRGIDKYRQFLAIAAVLTVILFSWAAPGCVFLLNGLLDTSKPITVTTLAIKKSYSSSSKGIGKTYYVWLQSWRNDQSAIKVEVSSEVYKQTSPHRTRIQLVTKMGGLGFTRLLEHRVANE